MPTPLIIIITLFVLNWIIRILIRKNPQNKSLMKLSFFIQGQAPIWRFRRWIQKLHPWTMHYDEMHSRTSIEGKYFYHYKSHMNYLRHYASIIWIWFFRMRSPFSKSGPASWRRLRSKITPTRSKSLRNWSLGCPDYRISRMSDKWNTWWVHTQYSKC